MLSFQVMAAVGSAAGEDRVDPAKEAGPGLGRRRLAGGPGGLGGAGGAGLPVAAGVVE